MMKKRVLVTGGAGFLGAHLCRRLIRKGAAVICLDNLWTGRMDNIRSLAAHPDFTFVRHDVTEPFYAETDQIYNLACPASPAHYQRYPVETCKTSVLGAINMLELAKRTGAKVLQASTSEVYGDPEQHPQTEVYNGCVNSTGIRACYDEGKRAAEALFFDYHRQYGVDIKVMRIFNTYGPGMQPGDGRVIPNFITQALAGRDITVYGDGKQTRSFCYVDDVIEAMIRLMEAENGFTGPVNVGNPCECTVGMLAEQIIARTQSGSKVVFSPLPPDDPKRRRPDIGLAQRTLGWKPLIGLEEGLERTIAYYRTGAWTDDA
ncbi:MAG: SDR family oxidoreductase [Eubacteriales bacterium]|nr:SDR family oxidoreductase [Eubacteriales bacterium]